MLLVLLWAHAVGLPLFGIARGYGPLHSLQEGAIVGAIAALAVLAGSRQRVASTLVSLGLITSSALLVHLWGGVIEAHFHFFVMIVVLALYEDWLPFLLAAAYVVIHHGLTGALDPASVYNHPDAVANPWKWAVIHGLFVTAAGIGAVATWRLNESVRAETQTAYRRARESEERFKSAFENAPIGMVLASIDRHDIGRLVQVNRAMCEMTGHSEVDLLSASFEDAFHPDDAEASVAVVQDVAVGRESPPTEHRLVHEDGRVLWCLVNVSLVRDDSGEPLYAIAQVQDITEAKRAEKQLVYQAYHDSLTELPNRRALMEDLERHLASATRAEPVMLLLFDLDGFKLYNDTFGHPAGDDLLARLGCRLGTAVEGRGVGYRMGGDEFCVLAGLDADGEVPLASVTAAALHEQGEGFAITASYGSVILPAEATDSAAALRKADERLYARKGTRRASAGRQATDLLQRALSEQSPELGSHLRDVTDWCEAVADVLEVPEEDRTALLQAAALHDVGKVAIPEAISEKPARLGEADTAFMRKHTLVGERILSAAPALTQAAKIVRATHERFDGHGYPDGLVGEEIPLGARVIAVCDAYDAMISARPFRVAMSSEGACSELRRNSGKQFDPRVVDAFLTVIAQRHGAGADTVPT